MANSTNDPRQSDTGQGLSSTPPSDSPAPNDELLREAGGGSFGSIISDVTDFAVHASPLSGVSDIAELIITGKPHMDNKVDTAVKQGEIAEAAGDTGIDSQIGRILFPNTYEEVQHMYVNKERNDAKSEDEMS